MSHLVVVGLGYVGLPLVSEAVQAGLTVVGLDVSDDVVAGLNSGRSHVDDLSDADIAALVDRGFRATSDAAVVGAADTVVICVPTPLTTEGGPDLSAVEAACRSIAPHLRPDALVVLESTTYPGTTAEVVVPLLEAGSGLVAGRDLHAAYSPERIDPGNPTYGLKNTPKVVGADHPDSTERVRAFYAQLVDDVRVATGTREAESAKLLENTYRHVNIALVNEMARIFHGLGIDFWDVLQLAASKPFGFQSFRPGPGVGGHCIPIDPNYLSYRVRSELGYRFQFVELAQEVNASMPGYVATRAAELLNDVGLPVRGSKIVLLGVTYKPDIADQRESPAIPVAERLLDMGADLSFHDPHVAEWSATGVRAVVGDLGEALAAADLTILLQDHSAYDLAALESSASRLLDTRGVTTGPRSQRL